MSRAKRWCFTINNPTAADDERLAAITQDNCAYAIWQLEEGERGTHHYQGFVVFDNRVRIPHLRELFGPRGHYEKARGSIAQNKAYCSKEPRLAPTVEVGLLPDEEPARQSDLGRATELVVSGGTLRRVGQEMPSAYVRNYRGLASLRSLLHLPPRRDNLCCVWLYGKSGCGKSRLAHELGGDDYYSHPLSKWWDGYDGERCIIFDDIRADSLGPNTFDQLLRILDRYPYRCEVKGGYAALRADRYVFTCVSAPRDVFSLIGDVEYAQLRRRIHHEVCIENGESFSWENGIIYNVDSL